MSWTVKLTYLAAPAGDDAQAKMDAITDVLPGKAHPQLFFDANGGFTEITVEVNGEDLHDALDQGLFACRFATKLIGQRVDSVQILSEAEVARRLGGDEARQQMQHWMESPELLPDNDTTRKIDAFLADPSTGVHRERPTRG